MRGGNVLRGAAYRMRAAAAAGAMPFVWPEEVEITLTGVEVVGFALFGLGVACIVAGLVVETRRRRRAEEALRALSAGLEARVIARTAEVAAANEELAATADALRASEQTLGAIIAASPVAIVTTDAAGHIRTWNPAAAAQFGWTADEVRATVSPLVPPEHADAFAALCARVAEGAVVSGFDVRVTRRDGAPTDVRVSAAPLRDGAGTTTGLVFLLADVTAAKEAEAQIHASQEALRALAAEVVATEERERRRLAQLLHDSIIQTLALAKMRLAALGAPREEAAPLAALLDDALQHARTLTFALSPPVLHELGLGAALEWLAEDLQRQHGLTITVRRPPTSPSLDDDLRTFLYMAAREALLNVVKHAGARSVRVTLATDATTVTLCVEDDGVGFDPARRDRPRARGGGFGLFSLDERVRYLGGRLTLDSAPGRGTRVTLAMPLGVPAAEGDRDAGAHPARR